MTGSCPGPNAAEDQGAGAVNYQLKNYDKAIEFGKRAIKGGFANEEKRNLVAQAYYLKGDWKGTLEIEQELVDSEIKAGQKPKEQPLQLSVERLREARGQGLHGSRRWSAGDLLPEARVLAEPALSTCSSQASGNDANPLQTFRLMPKSMC